MPYRFELAHERLPEDADRRRKLNDRERNDIRRRYKAGESIRAIARAYQDKCSRRLVQIVLFPERGEQIARQAKERGQHRKSYARVRGEEWARTMREHRRYKHRVLK